jgi:NADH:ubiquinone oxidoreductase subunit E
VWELFNSNSRTDIPKGISKIEIENYLNRFLLSEENVMSEVQKCCNCQHEQTEEELLVILEDVLNDYKDKPGALIPVLQIAQNMFGYLPEAALKKIALKMEKPYSEVAGVVSFYSFFSTVPRGKYVIRICLGTACYVRGGKDVLDAFKNKLKIDVGGTTDDRLFSLDVGRCFGACGLAPVIMVNDETFERVKPDRIEQIIGIFQKKEQEENIEENVNG